MHVVPSPLPAPVRRDPKRTAESNVYDLLSHAKVMPEAKGVYSLRIAAHRYKQEAEADFVVVGPQGILVLEVKGGGVGCDNDGRWYSVDRRGVQHTLSESPFEQASGAMYALAAYLESKLGDAFRKATLFGYGVIFPHADVNVDSEEWAQAVVASSTDVASPGRLAGYLSRLYDHWNRRGGNGRKKRLSHEDVAGVIQALRPAFESRYNEAAFGNGVVRDLDRLTEEQLAVYTAVAANPRILCEGGAGTGKTFVAQRAASAHAAAGRRTLFVCRSPALASRLDALLGRQTLLETLSAHRLPSITGDSRFDALVVDEGQDLLQADTLFALDGLLHGGLAAGTWLWSQDLRSQAGFYGPPEPGALELLLEGQPVRLQLIRNCRNPNEVTDYLRFLTGANIEGTGVSGRPVSVAFARDATDAAGRLTLALRSLLRDGVNKGAVTLLSPLVTDGDLTNSVAARLPDDLRRNLMRLDAASAASWPFSGVSVSSTRDFKGLENDFVFLIDFDPATLGDRLVPELYTAISRARVSLTILFPERARGAVEALAHRHLTASPVT